MMTDRNSLVIVARLSHATTSTLRYLQHTGARARTPVDRNQNPAKPCGLLYGIAALVISSREPSGRVA